MPAPRHLGRHELGQNFLIDKDVVGRIVDLADARPGPLVEWGTGDGALTLALTRLGRPLEGVEIDGRRVDMLSRRVGPHVCITEGDILRHAPPANSVVISNVPFHLTTPVLRHLLGLTTWNHAILITQWEVARKRAAVGGTTQLTAQWWPWFEFGLDRRVPASAFRPRPSVDAGVLVIDRRTTPLLPPGGQQRYQRWISKAFAGRGRGIDEILRRTGVDPVVAKSIAARVGQRALPRDLGVNDWVTAYNAVRGKPGR